MEILSRGSHRARCNEREAPPDSFAALGQKDGHAHAVDRTCSPAPQPRASRARRTTITRPPRASRAIRRTTTRPRWRHSAGSSCASRRGPSLEHVGRFSFDPGVLPGNVENFTGVAQVPIGVAGPLRINGEHARGDFYVPLATTEGTLVASYNRGMRVLGECGGVKTTVVEDSMQRAPVFIFDDALEAREFGDWIDQHEEEIRAAAEATTRSGKLTYIGQYQVGPLLYLRVNFTTGDAAGQNMTAKATQAACEWMKANYPGGAEYRLTGAIDTDKKHSHINMLLTRGQARRRRGRDQERRARAADGRRHEVGVRLPAGPHASADSSPAPPPTARTPPTASPRSSSPPARTSPTSRNRKPRSPIRSCSRTATTTGRSR